MKLSRNFMILLARPGLNHLFLPGVALVPGRRLPLTAMERSE